MTCDVDDAIEAARRHDVQFVLLALQWSNDRRRDLISERLQILPVPVLLLPDEFIVGCSLKESAKLARSLPSKFNARHFLPRN